MLFVFTLHAVSDSIANPDFVDAITIKAPELVHLTALCRSGPGCWRRCGFARVSRAAVYFVAVVSAVIHRVAFPPFRNAALVLASKLPRATFSLIKYPMLVKEEFSMFQFTVGMGMGVVVLIVAVQLASSDPSGQSLSPSQSQDLKMHRSFLH
jgi:hypothetical protein